MEAARCLGIFEGTIADYHLQGDVDVPLRSPFPHGSLEHLLYSKHWIDKVQWHLEDIVRDPTIDALLSDSAAGRKRMRLCKQVKMYNDASLNPVLCRAGQS